MSQMGVFVYINDQKKEALQLINDPKYKVKNKVNVTQFNKVMNPLNKTPVNVYILKLLFKGLAVLVVIALIIYEITKYVE